jgi:hypothetical protein
LYTFGRLEGCGCQIRGIAVTREVSQLLLYFVNSVASGAGVDETEMKAAGQILYSVFGCHDARPSPRHSTAFLEALQGLKNNASCRTTPAPIPNRQFAFPNPCGQINPCKIILKPPTATLQKCRNASLRTCSALVRGWVLSGERKR